MQVMRLVQSEFAADIEPVNIDGTFRNIKQFGYFLCRSALLYEACNLDLAVGKIHVL